MKQVILMAVILLPLAAGVLLPICNPKTGKQRAYFVLTTLFLEAALVSWLLLQDEAACSVFSMTPSLTIAFRMDGVSRLFLLIAAYGFLLAGIYALRYMEHAGRENSFFSFFLLSLGALAGMDLSGNLITMYLFFEMLTLLSMPMVLHDRSKGSIRAGLKYLYYSIAGAFLGLLCIFFLSRYCTTLDFVGGGSLDPVLAQKHRTLLQVVSFLGVLGFGAKAGMYPLHGWLPTAHPVAPAPASAVLSGIIAKAGVLAILRTVYFSVGADFLRGTWVQTALLSLALLTVFMGSMMAYRERVFKKRLAYSSVSQISYVLVGLFFLTEQSAVGGLLHILFHAVIKICLFLVAGSFIVNTGKHRVDEYRGYGKSMPKTMWAFTLASLALVGIPPASGFVSKWYLALGALDSDVELFSWLAPVVLLISALLTAGYLFPITIAGFFPGKDAALPKKNDEGGKRMWVPILLLGLLSVALGLFAAPLLRWMETIAKAMLGI